MVNYHGRVFKGTVNYNTGDLNQETRFKYYQQGSVVWAEIIGGGVALGSLLARLEADGNLTLVWQYINRAGALKAGTGAIRLEELPDGRYRLHESWRETYGGSQGSTSVVEEVRQGVQM